MPRGAEAASGIRLKEIRKPEGEIIWVDHAPGGATAFRYLFLKDKGRRKI